MVKESLRDNRNTTDPTAIERGETKHEYEEEEEEEKKEIDIDRVLNK